MNTAIIVAAGSGKRFGSDTPKQFLELKGKPVIAHTLSRFQDCGAVDTIVIAGHGDEIDNLRDIAERFGITKLAAVVTGGETRAESVKSGFAAVNTDAEIVAVHDGVRPLVPVRDIDLTIRAAIEYGAACLTSEISDTIKRVEGGLIISTVDRGNLRRALTPQAFRYDILRRALDGSSLDSSFTDESLMVEQLGVPVHYVEGDARNIKITHPEDLRLAEIYMSEYLK
jgi:2-C-methyl-D-erythritol 4-phosphate cytidylyltransferase